MLAKTVRTRRLEIGAVEAAKAQNRVQQTRQWRGMVRLRENVIPGREGGSCGELSNNGLTTWGGDGAMGMLEMTRKQGVRNRHTTLLIEKDLMCG